MISEVAPLELSSRSSRELQRYQLDPSDPAGRQLPDVRLAVRLAAGGYEKHAELQRKVELRLR